MRTLESINKIIVGLVAVLFFCVVDATAQSSAVAKAEQQTARYFESINKSPSEQWAFVLQMPKGGDLHNHLSGSIYAESYIQWAAESGLCVNNQTFAAALPPCSPAQTAVRAALTNSLLYRQIIDAWSMRNWQLSGQSGHDHFFDTFGKFGAATYNQTGRMIADAASRAARGHVSYVELMITPDGTEASQLGQKVDWDSNADSTLNKLKNGGLDKAVAAGIKNLQEAEAQKEKLLKCGTREADAGCSVTIRYVGQVGRLAPLGVVFAQMATDFVLASDPNSKVVGLNLVQPEDGLASMQNFSLQMQMLHSLRQLYPAAHLSLHAGELAPGVVPPEGLTFHIRESVMTANAERIGHGVDLMHENDPYGLMKEMARRNVMVEICLTSNDVILGVSGADHPLATYLKYGVPVALATDDEGVSRSEMSREFLRAAKEQGLGYTQLKTMARNSLTYSFIDGKSLWKDGRIFSPVPECAQEFGEMKAGSGHCQQYLAASAKARLQWALEEQFRTFESKY
jgi:adenosine deaminase